MRALLLPPHPGVLAAGLFACLSPVLFGAGERLPEPVQAFFSSHCTGCHDATEAKGKVNLDLDRIDPGKREDAALLTHVHRALSKGEMPPKKKPRPPEAERGMVLEWLDTVLTQRTPPHSVSLRRLTRSEYARTITAVFGIPFRTPPGFPEDSRAHGFDNVAEALALSPPLIDAYAETATDIADQIFPTPQEAPPPSEVLTIPAKDLSSADGYGPSSRLVQERMRLFFRNYQTTTSKFGAKASGKYRVRFRASAFQAEPGALLRIRANNREFPIATEGVSEHEFTMNLHPGDGVGFQFPDGAFATIDANSPYKGIREDLMRLFKSKPRFLAAWLPLHEAVPEKTDGSIRLKPFVSKSYEIRKKTIQTAYEEEFAKPDLDLEAATPEAAQRVIDAMFVDKNPTGFGGYELHFYVIPMVWKFYSEGPCVDIHSVEIEGPVEGLEHPRYGRARSLQTALLGAPVSKLTTEESLDTAVRKLLRKLFRREATEGEVARYRALVGRHRLEGHTPEECLHLAVRTAMVSPQFLYRGASGEQLAAHDVAARLSYFLTLRPPDEPLAQTALRGELSTPEGVRAQAERLLSTKFCEDFIEDFVGQWLGTRGIPEIMPDASLGRFGNDHRKSVMKEPELLFAEILRENRPLSDFIAPDFTHTHSSVGLQMYGLDMPPVNARVPFAMTRVALPRDSRNGGLLGMAGVMMATANGVDTQPVLRGKWFLENILGDPPPPPPESVPAITPDTRGTKTIRDLMRAHTSDESCARCHEKIDPYGFVFETFDAIGQWRERYPVSGKRQKEDWPAVDATAQLTDGTPLSGIGDLKKRLLEDLRPFARCLTRKLYLYGSGRVPDYSEEKALNALADDAVARHRGFRDFLLDLTASEVFRQR